MTGTFLMEIEQVVPGKALCALIEPHYPKRSSKGGRPPLPVERIFRTYCLQQWCNFRITALKKPLIRPHQNENRTNDTRRTGESELP